MLCWHFLLVPFASAAIVSVIRNDLFNVKGTTTPAPKTTTKLEKNTQNIVKIDYLGSAGCSRCAPVFTQLATVFPKYSNTKRLSVNYYPYSLCQETTKDNNLKCGSDMNALHACYQKYYPGEEVFKGILKIHESNNVDAALNELTSCCTKVDKTKLKTCATGQEGRKLLAQAKVASDAALSSAGVNGQFAYPLIMVDGKIDDDIKSNIEDGLCKKYFKPPPKECQAVATPKPTTTAPTTKAPATKPTTNATSKTTTKAPVTTKASNKKNVTTTTPKSTTKAANSNRNVVNLEMLGSSTCGLCAQ